MSKTATKTIAELGALPELAGADPSRNPLDVFRLDIAQQLAKITGATFDAAFQSIATGSKLADFSVPIPRLRLQGKKPNEWSALIKEQVRESMPIPCTA